MQNSVRVAVARTSCPIRLFRAAKLCRTGVIAAFLLGLVACDRKPPPGRHAPGQTPAPASTPTPKPTPEPTPTPVPTPYVPQKTLNVGNIFNGVNFKARLETAFGTTATAERGMPDSYTVEVTVKVKVPKPHRSIEDLRKLNDKIDTVLPGLKAMLENARVSPFFDDLYRRKVTTIRTNLDRLDQIISRHNFFDCETILELQNPKTKRRMLLVQADMDVDTDGTDGDRISQLDAGSRTFQPFTSYRWNKRTPNPNPCKPLWEKRIADNEARIKDPKTPAADARSLKLDTARLRKELQDLQLHSFLIGAADPFIVLPSQMANGGKNGFEPHIGDYCVVMVGDGLYPAIIGDSGPSTKIGEASLRICRQISPRANGEMRPVNDLKATYLIFPNSGDRNWGPPDLKQWNTRCDTLLKEFDDYTGELFAWDDITQPTVPPALVAPVPAPARGTSPQPAQSTPKTAPTLPPSRKEPPG